MSDNREQPGRETAQERYTRIRKEHKESGAPGYPKTGWAAYCTAPTYCTRPCVECAAIGRKVDNEQATA